MKRGVITAAGLTVATVVVALLVALIGHERIRYENPTMVNSLVFGGLAVLYLIVKPQIRALFGPPRRKAK